MTGVYLLIVLIGLPILVVYLLYSSRKTFRWMLGKEKWLIEPEKNEEPMVGFDDGTFDSKLVYALPPLIGLSEIRQLEALFANFEMSGLLRCPSCREFSERLNALEKIADDGIKTLKDYQAWLDAEANLDHWLRQEAIPHFAYLHPQPKNDRMIELLKQISILLKKGLRKRADLEKRKQIINDLALNIRQSLIKTD